MYAKKPGTAQVTVTTDQMGYKYTWNITVTEAILTGIDIKYDYDKLYVGEQAYFNAQALPEEASLEGMTWESSDPGVATIDSTTGKVEAKGIGKTVITAKKGEIKSAAFELNVAAKPENSVKVTFHNGDDVYAITYVDSNTKFSDVPQDENPVKAGFEFVGWATSPGSSDVIDNNFVIGTECKLYAVYKAKICEVIFTQGDGEEDVRKVNYGEDTTAPNAEADEGEEFLGWATSWNATKPEVKAGVKIKVTDDVTYYPVYGRRMIKITQSGENVKYYTGALKDANGDNLEYDEDRTLASKGNTGYMPYASENLMQLCFRAENGYIITKITLDDVPHDIIDSSEQGASFVRKAVAQGYVAVERNKDHTIIIETKKMDFTISKAGDGIKEIADEDGIMMYCVTGSAFSINDVVNVTVDKNLQPYSPNISYKYRSMQDSEENEKEIAKDDKVLKTDDDGGNCWLVTITLSLNGQNVKKWIRINVVSTQKSLIKSVAQMSANEIKILFYDNLTEEIAESDIIIFKKSESNEGNMSIESIRPLEDSKCAYIVKLTQKMVDQTEYVVSVSGSSKSFISSNNTVSKIE